MHWKSILLQHELKHHTCRKRVAVASKTHKMNNQYPYFLFTKLLRSGGTGEISAFRHQHVKERKSVSWANMAVREEDETLRHFRSSQRSGAFWNFDNVCKVTRNSVNCRVTTCYDVSFALWLTKKIMFVVKFDSASSRSIKHARWHEATL